MQIRPVVVLVILLALFADRTVTAKKFDRSPEPSLKTLSAGEFENVRRDFLTSSSSVKKRRFQFEFCEPQDDDLREWKKTLNLIMRELTKISLSKPAITSAGKCTRYDGEIEGSIRLNLSGASLVDLRPIAAIDYLFELNLSHNLITSITPLEDMKLLFGLDISFNKIENMGRLKGLDHLNTLDASDNKISTVAPPSSLHLYQINLKNNQIQDALPLLNGGSQSLERIFLKGNPLNRASEELSLNSLFGRPTLWRKPSPGMVETFTRQEWDRIAITIDAGPKPKKAYIWEKTANVLHLVEEIGKKAASKPETANPKYFQFRINQQDWRARRWDVKGYVDKLNRIDTDAEDIIEPTGSLMCSGNRQRESYSIAKFDERAKGSSFQRCKAAGLQVGSTASIDKVKALADQFAAIVRSGPPELPPLTFSHSRPRCLFLGTPAQALFYKGEVFTQRCEHTGFNSNYAAQVTLDEDFAELQEAREFAKLVDPAGSCTQDSECEILVQDNGFGVKKCSVNRNSIHKKKVESLMKALLTLQTRGNRRSLVEYNQNLGTPKCVKGKCAEVDTPFEMLYKSISK